MSWKAVIGIMLLAVGCTKSSAPVRDIGTACTRNADCAANVCLPVSTALNVCTANCATVNDCPAGWSCEPLSSGGASLCDCIPTAEVCDGVDNNCNGLIDEGCGVTAADLSGADLTLPPVPMTNKIDVLFVVDNSPSMTPIQDALKSAFPTFATAIDSFPQKTGGGASFHIGVVTTDLGAGLTTIGTQCRPGGNGGKLQPLGAAHAAGCMPPTGGENFIDIDQVGGGNNLPAGQTLEQTFACMASVGDQGCGFEHVLESPYKALHDVPPENAGFLRDDALLVVVWVTNEDDCSAPPDSDLFDPNKSAIYGAELSYRCSNYGIMCGDPPMLMPYSAPSGNLAMCQGATVAAGGKLFEVGRYLDYFTKAGGVKANPAAVILASLAAPPTPVATVLMNPSTQQPCSGQLSSSCAVTLSHSCMQSATVFGDPAVRLSQVVRGAPRFFEASVCDGTYGAALQSIADVIQAARSAP